MPRRRPLASRPVIGGIVLTLVGWMLLPQPAAGVQAAKPFDFNGDGFADLATGVPGESIGAIEQAGAVQVIYGSKRGLTPADATLWSRATVGIDGDPSTREELGRGLASADFDRDGYADLAALTCTQVMIIYGSPTGLSVRHQFLTPPVRRIRCEFFDEGLQALVTGDFDDDAFPDLAVTASSPARVFVYSGTAAGPGPQVDETFSKAPPTPKKDTYKDIGNGMAAGDLDGDGVDDLVVGTGLGRIDSTGTDVGTIPGFYVVPGSAAGLRPDRRRFIAGWRLVGTGQRRRHVPAGLAPAGGTISEGFGHQLAVADFNRDGYGDVAVSDPEGSSDRNDCSYACAGGVFILYGSKRGPQARNRQYWSMSTQRPWDGDETYPEGNNFGAELAVGDIDRDGHIDLAIAAPHDQSNYGRPGVAKDRVNPGNVYVLYGAAHGLARTGRQIWAQRSRGIPGQAKAWEGFGSGGLQILDHGNGSGADLAIHTPRDRSGRGTVSVIYGSTDGLNASQAQLWHQDMPGIPDMGEQAESSSDGFGTL